MSEDLNAQESQGFLNNPKGDVKQHYGDKNIYRSQGDMATRDIDKRINITLNIFGKSYDTNKEEFDFDKLIHILEQLNIESILKADQTSLYNKPDADLFYKQKNSIEEILSQIINSKRLPEFLDSLNNDKNISDELRCQLNNVLNGYLPRNEQRQSITPQELNQLQSYLLIAVYNDHSSDDKFKLKAWLIPDNTISGTNSNRYKQINIDTENDNKLYGFEEIPELLDKIYKNSQEYLIQLDNAHDLTIEIFLPSQQLICAEVEHWKINRRESLIHIGTRHPVIVRSSERQNRSYLRDCLNDWRKNWKKVEKLLQNTPTSEVFEHIEQLEDCKWNDIVAKFLKNKQKIGFKIGCSISELKQEQEDLFKALDNAAVPIALWIRYDVPHRNCSSEINSLLTSCQLMRLPEHIRERREETCTSENPPENHLEYHLSLLWEDPSRLTPDVMFELKTTGQ